MAGPWERYGGAHQQQQAIPRVIEGPPRTPAPRYEDEAESVTLRNQRTRQEIDQAPIQTENAQLQNQRTRRDLQQSSTAGANFQDENALRNAYRQEGSVAALQDVLPAYYSAMYDAQDNRAGDLNLIYAFSKLMDPGSVVREGEAVMVRDTGSLGQQVRGYLNILTGEGALTPEIRQQLRSELRSRGQGIGYAYRQARERYAGLAQRYGFAPDAIIGPDLRTPYRQRLQGVSSDQAPNVTSEFLFGDEDSASPRQGLEGGEEFRRQFEAALNSGRFQTADEAMAYAEQLNPYIARLVNRGDVGKVIQYRQRGGRRHVPVNLPAGPTAAAVQAQQVDQVQGQAGADELLQQGATLNLGDEASGVGGALYNMASAPFVEGRDFDPIGAYQTTRDAQRLRLEGARERTGALGTAAEVLGGFASARPTLGPIGLGPGGRTVWEGAPNAPTLGGRMAQGARVGAPIGALAGFGSGEGPQDSILQGALGGFGGASLGAGLPLLGAGATALAGGVRTMAGRNPNLARSTIARAIADDGNTPAAVGAQMADAQSNGVPYMLADSGDNVRGLLAASARAPGSGRTLARDALDERQGGLGDRVASAIERDLGPASNPHEVADQLMQAARTQAAPLYEAAYARPGADTFAQRIGGLINRPAVQRALGRARAIAQEEGRDPNTLGFEVNSAGETAVSRTPSWQTFDYLKRGMDDVLQAQPRDPATGALILDEGTRAIQGTLRSFLGQIDRANPEYAAARAAWAGPVQSREAMDLGRRALNMTADDFAARTRQMSPNELEFFRLGVRRAMTESIANAGDTANVVHRLVGTGRKRALIQRLFGGRQEFDRFISTLQQEQAGFQTYRTARLGSPTAPNLQDDAALSSAVTTGLADMATTGLPITTAVRQAVRFGTGRAARHAQEQISSILSESDPARLRELARELNREAARLRRGRYSAGRRATGYGVGAGEAGAALADR